jgi:hypothetical protein
MARRTYDPTEVGETTLLRWGDLRWGDVQEATTGRRAQRARGSHDGRGLGEGDSTAAWAVCTREGIAPFPVPADRGPERRPSCLAISRWQS